MTSTYTLLGQNSYSEKSSEFVSPPLAELCPLTPLCRYSEEGNTGVPLTLALTIPYLTAHFSTPFPTGYTLPQADLVQWVVWVGQGGKRAT